MKTGDTVANVTPTLDFMTFWNWLVMHPNCILRAGTQDAILYDDDDLHWHLASEGPETVVVQVIRGKRLLGEILISPEQISYIQGSPGELEGEYIFELITETENDRVLHGFFVLSHAYEEQEPLSSRPVH